MERRDELCGTVDDGDSTPRLREKLSLFIHEEREKDTPAPPH
jgi:hypothetical protein